MDGRRRQQWDNCGQDVPRRRWQFKPPRRKWLPTVPSWEKEFCKVVGTLNWETLLQMKKAVHLYDNVIKWNDSAGEEAFFNAKNRFWAEINGFPCNIELPNPDLYIDDVNWNLENDVELLLDDEITPSIPNTEENKDSVVIFGDSLISNQEFSPVGWGDYDQDVKVPAKLSNANNEFGNSVNDRTVAAWPGFCYNPWHFSNERATAGYMPWGSGWNNSWGWNNHVDYEAGRQIVRHSRDYEQHGTWGYNNVQGNYRNSGTKGSDNFTSHLPKNNKR